MNISVLSGLYGCMAEKVQGHSVVIPVIQNPTRLLPALGQPSLSLFSLIFIFPLICLSITIFKLNLLSLSCPFSLYILIPLPFPPLLHSSPFLSLSLSWRLYLFLSLYLYLYLPIYSRQIRSALYFQLLFPFVQKNRQETCKIRVVSNFRADVLCEELTNKALHLYNSSMRKQMPLMSRLFIASEIIRTAENPDKLTQHINSGY